MSTILVALHDSSALPILFVTTGKGWSVIVGGTGDKNIFNF